MPERRLDFRCECGAECRIVVDAPTSGASVADFIRHCDQGRVWPIPGRPLAFLEKLDGQWKRVPRW